MGLGLAWVAAPPARTARAQQGTATWAILGVFGFAVLAPYCAFFLSFAPDWSFAYLVDTERLPQYLLLLVPLLAGASVTMGYLVGQPAATQGRLGKLLRLAAAPSLLLLLLLAATLTRLRVDASYPQYHGDFGRRSVMASPLGAALVWFDAALLLGLLSTAGALRGYAARPRGD